MCVHIDLGGGKTWEAVETNNIRAFQGYSFWSMGVVLRRTGYLHGFSRGSCLLSGLHCTARTWYLQNWNLQIKRQWYLYAEYTNRDLMM